MRRTPVRPDGALIVGGGPAGAATAIQLARAGAPHLLVERTRETGDAICGGFLSWRTLETLATLGIDADTLNPVAVRRARVFGRGGVAEAMLPRPARSVSRRHLDTVLLAQAAACGAAIERGVTVRAIDDAVRLDDGSALQPETLFLASGKHDVRGLARPAEARGRDPTLGLRVRLAPSAALTRLIGDTIELHPIDRGYVGIALQEDGSANVCMAVHRSRLHEAGDPAALLRALGNEYPALGDRLAHQASDAGIDAIANVPYGWRVRGGVAGQFRLGDQAGVIPSLAGEGMGIAIASGVSAAHAFLSGASAVDWQTDFARRIARPIAIADMVRGLAERPAAARITLPILRIAPMLMQIIASATRIAHHRG